MEGWLYGLFTLAGVLAGGLFSYLGMKKQLEQRNEIDSRQWRRKVRSEPLLKLRDALANMATKQDRLIIAAWGQLYIKGATEEAVRGELQRAADDWNAYLVSGDFAQTLFMQYDAELFDKAKEILKDYQESCFNAIHLNQVSVEEQVKSRKVSERMEPKIVEAQELINKRLEEL
jgi:hypothetical protein